MSHTHVIVGAGAAGLAAVRAIRRRDATGRIVVVTAESGPAYSPALLPYLLAGKVTEAGLTLADRHFYVANRAELVEGTRVVGVDFDGRRILVEPGRPIEYTTLLIATGASARGDEVPGATIADGPLTLRTLADARVMRDRLQRVDSVAVLGAGLAGLEIAMAARTLGKRVTVVARSDQILSRNIGATDAAIVQGWLEEAGIRFLLGRQTTAVEHAGGRRCLTTVEGDAVPAELLVAAKGAAPNIAWAAPVGARTDQGLAVDGGMRTGIPNVFAAGDAALARHAVTGRVEACATWPSACAQGAVAGANMAGGDAWLAGEIPFNVLPIFDRRVSFMGCTSREALGCLGEGVEHTVVGRPAAGRGRTLWFHDGRVVGAVVFGSQPDAGRLRQAILSGGRVASRHGEVKQLPSLPAAHRRGRSHRR
jgi:NADPH-dependent 2,4-dienoyl-CoA reductase/sulfur reductase-like enzyme